MELRHYQIECIETVNDYLMSTNTHGVVSLATGSGKTIIFATMIRDWLIQWPDTRVCILAHRQELLTQSEDKLKRVWPEAPIGVWSAGLNRKEGNRSILIAGIQSVYKRACDFDPFDILIIDEAHLCPNSSDTMYRRFIKEALMVNPKLRIIGWTATPYRLDGGELCGEGKLFTHVIYEAPINTMVADGYICNLRTKAAATKLDAKGLHIRQGDYVADEMETKFNTDGLVSQAVDEIVAKGADRKSWLIFCCGVKHAHHVAEELGKRGIVAPVITGETPKDKRAAVLASFDAGETRAVVNCNCLTTGLDVTRIDMIVLLRCTASTSLFVQMTGRGFRLHPDKKDCLVLDMGENVRRHGPLDNLRIKKKGDGGGEAPVKVCPECAEYVHAAVAVCPCCGFQFPPREINHSAKASDAPLLSSAKPWVMEVQRVEVRRHEKVGKPPSLEVSYLNEFECHRTWICLEHFGYAQEKARSWWRRMFNVEPPATVDEALNELFSGHSLADQIRARTAWIKVRQDGRYTQIIDYRLNEANAALNGT